MGAYRGDAARYNLVSCRVTDETYDTLKAYCKQSKVSVSAFLSQLIEDELEKSARTIKKNKGIRI